MLECLKPVKDKNWDCLSFFEDPDDEEQVFIHASTYKDPGESVIGANGGQVYHIVLVQDHDEDPEKFINFDHFEAVLFGPLDYVSELIPCGWYGLVAKKTSTSHKFVDEAIDKIKCFL